MKIFSSPDQAMVGHLKNLLGMHDITCTIRGEYRNIAFGEIPPNECWLELWLLDRSQAEQAKQIIKDALTPIENNADSWQCPNCKEDMEAQFTDCWSCGTARSRKENI